MLLIKGIMDGFHSIILYDIFMTGLMFGVGLVLAVVTYYLIKWLFYLTMKYLKWNISIVKEVYNHEKIAAIILLIGLSLIIICSVGVYAQNKN